jgi:hypothetical protein
MADDEIARALGLPTPRGQDNPAAGPFVADMWGNVKIKGKEYAPEFHDIEHGGKSHVFIVSPNGDVVLGKQDLAYVKNEMLAIRHLYDDPRYAETVKLGVEEQLGVLAPEIASNTANTLTSMLGFLASKIPQMNDGDKAYLSSIQNENESISKQQAVEYMRYVRAMEKPLDVLNEIANGSVNKQGLEVIQKFYPKIYAEFLRQLIDKLHSQGKQIPYAKRIMLAQLFGIPLAEVTMTPDFVALLQQTAQAQQQKRQAQQQQSPQQNMRMTGLKSLGQAVDDSITNTQRIEGGIK